MRKLDIFEAIVIFTVMELGPEGAYGVAIGNRIEESGLKRPSVGNLYTTLARLEIKKFLTSEKSFPTNERGGKAKTYYRLTDLGREAFLESQRILSALIKPADGTT